MVVFVVGIVLLFWIIGLMAVIWVIYDVLTNQKRMPDSEKIVWILVALFLNLIGAVVYYILVKASGKYEETPEERPKGPDQPIEI